MIGKTIGFGILGAVGGLTTTIVIQLINEKMGRDKYYAINPEYRTTPPDTGLDPGPFNPKDGQEMLEIGVGLMIGGAVVSAIVGGGIGSAVVRGVKDQTSRLLS
jgi:hypothetical protein